MGRVGAFSGRLPDSPSRQLILELAKDLEKVRIHHEDLKRVKAYERRSFYEYLDERDRDREAKHNAAIDAAAAISDRNRREAEEALQQHAREVEAERRREAEAANRERERLEREKAAKVRRDQEEAARREAERRAKEEEARRKEEEARRKAEQAAREKKAAEEEKARQERERLEVEEAKRRKATEEAAARQKEEEKASQLATAKKAGASHLPTEEIDAQKRYLEVHKNLKELRRFMKEEGKKNANLKTATGDLRRLIVKCVGQLREGKGANKSQLQEIRGALDKAATISQPSVDIRNFMAFPPDHIANSNDTQVPAMLIYLLNILSKNLIAHLVTEAGINPGYAEPLGIVAAQIFSMEAFMYRGCHMVDILWAKYRVVCPALWGFYGDESTAEGKSAVGWRRVEPGGPFIKEQAHAERMTGLGAGFAALTLRNFGKTPRQNPFPNILFWQAMHRIVTIPTTELQDTHYYLINALLRNSAERIVGFFGHIGLAAMRIAIVDIPNKAPKNTTAINTLRLLRELYKREKNILI